MSDRKPGQRGAPRRARCVHGHDLTNDENVALAKRGDGLERQCIPCRRKRSREAWRKKHWDDYQEDVS